MPGQSETLFANFAESAFWLARNGKVLTALKILSDRLQVNNIDSF